MTLSDIVLSLYASRSFVSELYSCIIKQPLSHITVEWSKFSYSLLLLDDEKMMQDAERCPDLLLDDRRCEKLSENAQISCFVNRPYDIIPIKDVSVLKRKMVSAGGSKSNRNPCAARISARAASTAVLERLLHTQEVDGSSPPVSTIKLHQKRCRCEKPRSFIDFRVFLRPIFEVGKKISVSVK